MEAVEFEEEIEESSKTSQGRRWFLTINNPTETDEEMCQYIENLEHFKYSKFQREKGHNEETEHFQIFIIFTIGKRFNTIKNYFPRAHIEQAKGSNVQCRDYCSKTDTRVSGPYELGQFAEERQRTDKQAFVEMARAGMSDEDIYHALPSLYLSHSKDIGSLHRKALYEKFKNEWRNVEVTYIYGPPRTGKTSYVYEHHDKDDVFRVTLYGNSSFDAYKAEDVIVFDEFDSSFKITYMNHYLDGYYVELPARYDNRFTMYTKVYIISNLPLKKQYLNEQETKPEIYDAFCQRIHNIIRIDKLGGPVVFEKQRAQGVQQEMELTEITKEAEEELPW